MKWHDVAERIALRLNEAHARALTVAPTIVHLKRRRNRRLTELEPHESYLEGYFKTVTGKRHGHGFGYDRHFATVFVRILVPRESGDERIYQLADAVAPAFRTAGDGLQFEDAPVLRDLAEQDPPGTHFGKVWSALFSWFDVEDVGNG